MFLLSFFQLFVFPGFFLVTPSFPQVKAQPASNAATAYLALFEQLPKLESMTDEQREVVSNWKEAELDKNAAKVVALYQPAFKLMHQAAALKNCDWSIRPKSTSLYPKSGLIDYFEKARELLNAVGLSARLAFAEKQYRGAVDDLLDLLVLARHFQKGESVVDRLVADAFERDAITLLAEHLNEIRDPQILKVIQQRYSGLPSVVSVQEILVKDNQASRSLLKQMPAATPEKETSETEKKEAEKVIKMMAEQNEEVTKQAAAIAALPPIQQEEAVTAFEAKIKAERGFGRLIAPAYAKVIRATRIGLAQRAMFSAALDMQIDGVEQLKKHPDPFGTGPFEYRKLENGFELKSKLKDGKAEQVALKVGN